MDLLYAMRDFGVAAPAVGDAGDERARAALANEINRATHPDTSGWDRSLKRDGPVTRPRRGRRRVAALASAGVLVICAGVAVAAVVNPWSLLSSDSPTSLFRSNPAYWNQQNPPNSNTAVIASSVTDLGTINVPGVGAFQYWGAQTKNGEWCEAFKAPDGAWAGTPVTGSGKSDPSYNFSGDVPGCATYSNVPQGGGFHFSMNEIGPIVPGNNPATVNDLSAVIYGTIDNPGQSTTVVDSTTGASTPILDGHYFALILPRPSLSTVQLKAVDGPGNIIARANPYTP